MGDESELGTAGQAPEYGACMRAQRSFRQKKRVNERRKRVLTLVLLIISLMLAAALGVFLGVNYRD
jgi:hypothetical protein